MSKEDLKEENNKEFKERMTLMEFQRESDRIKHLFKMQELEFEQATHKLLHEQILERGRIHRAESRKDWSEKKQNWR